MGQSQSMLVCMLINLCKQEILSLWNFIYKELKFMELEFHVALLSLRIPA